MRCVRLFGLKDWWSDARLSSYKWKCANTKCRYKVFKLDFTEFFRSFNIPLVCSTFILSKVLQQSAEYWHLFLANPNFNFFICLVDKIENGDVYQRKKGPHSSSQELQETSCKQEEMASRTRSSWRRVLLLILAITIHNIPGRNDCMLLKTTNTRNDLKLTS